MVYKEMPKTNTKTETATATTTAAAIWANDCRTPERKRNRETRRFFVFSRGINNKRKRIKNVAKRTVLLRIRTTDRQAGGFKKLPLQY